MEKLTSIEKKCKSLKLIAKRELNDLYHQTRSLTCLYNLKIKMIIICILLMISILSYSQIKCPTYKTRAPYKVENTNKWIAYSLIGTSIITQAIAMGAKETGNQNLFISMQITSAASLLSVPVFKPLNIHSQAWYASTYIGLFYGLYKPVYNITTHRDISRLSDGFVETNITTADKIFLLTRPIFIGATFHITLKN